MIDFSEYSVKDLKELVEGHDLHSHIENYSQITRKELEGILIDFLEFLNSKIINRKANKEKAKANKINLEEDDEKPKKYVNTTNFTFKELKEVQDDLHIKNLILMSPDPSDLENLPQELEYLILDNLDRDFESNTPLPIFLKEIIVRSASIISNKKEPLKELEKRFKLPFGCKVSRFGDNKKDTTFYDFCKKKGLTEKNLYSRKKIKKLHLYYSISVKSFISPISEKTEKEFMVIPEYVMKMSRKN